MIKEGYSSRQLGDEKRKELKLYLEGIGFGGIGKVLGVSNVSVLNWIRFFGV